MDVGNVSAMAWAVNRHCLAILDKERLLAAGGWDGKRRCYVVCDKIAAAQLNLIF